MKYYKQLVVEEERWGGEFINGMEAASGFEPENNGFADRRLTTWLCRRLRLVISEP